MTKRYISIPTLNRQLLAWMFIVIQKRNFRKLLRKHDRHKTFVAVQEKQSLQKTLKATRLLFGLFISLPIVLIPIAHILNFS